MSCLEILETAVPCVLRKICFMHGFRVLHNLSWWVIQVADIDVKNPGPVWDGEQTLLKMGYVPYWYRILSINSMIEFTQTHVEVLAFLGHGAWPPGLLGRKDYIPSTRCLSTHIENMQILKPNCKGRHERLELGILGVTICFSRGYQFSGMRLNPVATGQEFWGQNRWYECFACLNRKVPKRTRNLGLMYSQFY